VRQNVPLPAHILTTPSLCVRSEDGIHPAEVEVEARGLSSCSPHLRTCPASHPDPHPPQGFAPGRSQKHFTARSSPASGTSGSRGPIQGCSASPVWGDALPVKPDSTLHPNTGVAFLTFAPKNISTFTLAVALVQPPQLSNTGAAFLSGKLMELDYGLIKEEGGDSGALLIQV